MKDKFVYLDNSATTKICKEALDKYNEVSLCTFGNPSSLHGMGVYAEKELKLARQRILESVYEKDSSIIFTSSGTEANNLAVTGRALAKARYKNGGKIITTEGEHASVSEPVKKLADMGFKVFFVKTHGGEVDLDELSYLLDESTFLLSIMMVNNETGAVYDIPKIRELMLQKAKNAVLHVDATQGYMKVPFSMKALGIDMLTVSSHKIEGPKGVGALIIKNSLLKTGGISPIVFGGGQEMGLRSGTENVPGIAAFGEAAKIGHENLNQNIKKMAELRQYLIDKLQGEKELSEISITNPKHSAPHILNITLPSIKSETMLHYLSREGIFVSSGSACSSNTKHISSALVAFGRSEKEADSSLRISFSHNNTKADVDALCDCLAFGLKTLARVR